MIAVPYGFLVFYGVVVGLVSVAGGTMAMHFIRMGRRGFAPGYILAACLALMLGLFAIMKYLGEFGPEVLGPNAGVLTLGFCAGAMIGVFVLIAFWLDRE